MQIDASFLGMTKRKVLFNYRTRFPINRRLQSIILFEYARAVCGSFHKFFFLIWCKLVCYFLSFACLPIVIGTGARKKQRKRQTKTNAPLFLSGQRTVKRLMGWKFILLL